MVSHDLTVIGIEYSKNTILRQYIGLSEATKTVKGAFGWSLFFQNSEHPKIDYFGFNKLSFDWLNMFFDSNKKILDLVGLAGKSLGRLVRKWNKGRQKNVDETGLWESIIKAKEHSLATYLPCMQ